MKPEIVSVLPVGHGDWEICVEQRYTKSKTIWTVILNDSTLIDEFRAGRKSAEKRLIRNTKMYGSKNNLEYSNKRW